MKLADILIEDITTDITMLQSRIADITVRKQRAMQVFDNQLKPLQMQVAQKTKMRATQSKTTLQSDLPTV